MFDEEHHDSDPNTDCMKHFNTTNTSVCHLTANILIKNTGARDQYLHPLYSTQIESLDPIRVLELSEDEHTPPAHPEKASSPPHWDPSADREQY